MKFAVNLIISLSLILSLHSSRVEAADHVGNGGDDYAIEFVGTAYEVLETLLYYPIKDVDPNQFLNAIRNTEINSKDKLFNGKYEVDALNYPKLNPAKIEISRNGWDRLDNELERRMLLVFHEYLGILQIDDGNYRLTQEFRKSIFCDKFSESKDPTKLKDCKRKTGVDVDLSLAETIVWFREYFKKRGIEFAHQMFSAKEVKQYKKMFKVYKACMNAWKQHFRKCPLNDVKWIHFNLRQGGSQLGLSYNGPFVSRIYFVSGTNLQTCFDALVLATEAGNKSCSKVKGSK